MPASMELFADRPRIWAARIAFSIVLFSLAVTAFLWIPALLVIIFPTLHALKFALSFLVLLFTPPSPFCNILPPEARLKVVSLASWAQLKIQAPLGALFALPKLAFYMSPLVWLTPLVVHVVFTVPPKILWRLVQAITGTETRSISASIIKSYRRVSSQFFDTAALVVRSPTFLTVQAKVSQSLSCVAWELLESPLADSSLDVASRLHQAMVRLHSWMAGFGSVFIVAPNVYSSDALSQNTPQAFDIVSMILFKPLRYVTLAFRDSAADINKSAGQHGSAANALVYETLALSAPADGDPNAKFTRILTILPGEAPQPLACKLKVRDLNHLEHPYQALSYVWGSPVLEHAISVNQKPFRITRSLFQALSRLRAPERPKYLWADGICINQGDMEEKGEQVMLMRQIYSNAASVVVWLGELQPFCLQHAWNTQRGAGSNIHYGTVRVFADLLSRPWWRRVWIVQETLLARELQVACGSQKIPWDSFCAIMERAFQHPLFDCERGEVHDYKMIVRRQRALRRAISRKEAGQPPDKGLENIGDLLSLVYDFRARGATEGRDKVFAFLGIAEEFSRLNAPGIETTPLVIPDYQRWAAFPNIEFARSHIHRTRKLGQVALAECSRWYGMAWLSHLSVKTTYIPTWCADFMHPNTVQKGLQWRPFWTGLEDKRGEGCFAAAGGLPTPPLEEPSPDPPSTRAGWCYEPRHYLLVHSLDQLKSTVVKVGPVADVSSSALVGAAHNVIESHSDLSAPIPGNWVDWEAILPEWKKLVVETVRMDGHRKGEPGTPGNTRAVEWNDDEMFNLTVTAGEFSTVTTGTHEQQNTAQSSPTSTEAPTQYNHESFSSARRNACYNRRLIITDTGLFGLGPAGTQVGDQICVLLGSQVPMIFRKEHVPERKKGGKADVLKQPPPAEENSIDVFSYIGQAYVHPMMRYPGDLRADIDTGRVTVRPMWLI